MNALNRYEVQKTTDTELLYNRVEDLENDVKVMQTLMETFATQVDKIIDKLIDLNKRVDLQTDIHEHSIIVMKEKNN